MYREYAWFQLLVSNYYLTEYIHEFAICVIKSKHYSLEVVPVTGSDVRTLNALY